MIPPDKFIPIAEDSNQISRIGDWVLDEACRQLAIWKADGLTLSMAVNLSAKQLRDREIVERITRVMKKHNIAEGELELEVTETAAMANAQHAIEQMHAIRSAGATLAIDDFGTGYSSLAYLKLFPVQTLKLDRTFVRDIETDENDSAICKASISLAHNMGMSVVAEGVETTGQRDFLVAHNCDTMQGYLFSRPLPAETLKLYLTANDEA